MSYTRNDAFKDLEKILVRNVANNLIQLDFHLMASDEQLEDYYGGGVNRVALVEDTLKRLKSDNFLLEFYQDNKRRIKKTYGDQNEIDDINRFIEQSTGISIAPRGGDQGTPEDGSGGPEQGPDDNTGPRDFPTESGDRIDTPEGDGGSLSNGSLEVPRVPGNDRGGERKRGAHEGGDSAPARDPNW